MIVSLQARARDRDASAMATMQERDREHDVNEPREDHVDQALPKKPAARPTTTPMLMVSMLVAR
jgi:hypothetical protein